MARNRIIYQTEALYAGPAPATGFHYGTFTAGSGGDSNDVNSTNLVKQLQRVQTANYSFTVDRTDVNQFGQLAALDRVILTSPTVALDFSYLLANLVNEKNIGLTIQTGTQAVSCLSGILNKNEDERNYFIKTTSEGTDAIGNSQTGFGVIGIGNGFVTSYSTEASVGNFPTTTINVEGLNMSFLTHESGISGNQIPAINPINGNPIEGKHFTLPGTVATTATDTNLSGISVLRPGDITVTLGGITGAKNTFNIQSYTLNFDLARTPIERLGSKFAFAREIDFPLTVNLSVDAQVTEYENGSLATLVSGDANTFYNPIISIKSPTGDQTVAKFELKRAKLDSQEFSSDIGSNKSVTLNFSCQIGGPQDQNN
ncbi:hypothetical protein EBU71_21805, partial [bacterium]|nr:hypothetical protein [Candidatus Elulimicrobium humile]